MKANTLRNSKAIDICLYLYLIASQETVNIQEDIDCNIDWMRIEDHWQFNRTATEVNAKGLANLLTNMTKLNMEDLFSNSKPHF